MAVKEREEDWARNLRPVLYFFSSKIKMTEKPRQRFMFICTWLMSHVIIDSLLILQFGGV